MNMRREDVVDSAVMAAKSCDDPMDLGPFLQNYVLRNPFHEFMLGSSQLSDVHPKTTDHLEPKICAMASSNGNQGTVDMISVPPLIGNLKRIFRPTDDGTTTDGLVKKRFYEKHQKLAMTSDVENNQCLKDRVDSVSYRDKDNIIKQELEEINDTKASKDTSVVLFENCELGGMKYVLSKHTEVHQWLLSNFEYLSQFHNCLISTRILLNEVQKTFPDVRKRTLGQLIAFVYPCCPKIVHDGETFYKGLVPKLAESHVQMPSRRNFNTHISRHACLTADCNDHQEESNDNNMDFEKMLQSLSRESIVHKMVFRPSSTTDGEWLLSSPADGSQYLSISCTEVPIPSEDATLKIEPITSMINVNCIDSASSCSSAVNDPDCIVAEDVQSNGSNNGQNFNDRVVEVCVPQTASSLTKFDYVTEIQELHWKKSTNSVSNDCVADLELQFQQARQDLAKCRCINVKLQTELESMQNENLVLKEELNTRDFHLVHLAEDFFKLHSQFKNLAEQFQLILNETQNSLNKTFPNCQCR